MNRAGIFKAGYSKKKDVVYPLPAFEGSPTSVTTEFDGTTREVTVLSGNSPETTSSEDKGSEKGGNESENKLVKSADTVDSGT